MPPCRVTSRVVAAAVLSCATTRAFLVPPAPAGSLTTRVSISKSIASPKPRQRSLGTVCMQSTLTYLDDPMLVPLTEDDYIAFGLACCFVMNDNLKLDEYHVYEPLTAGTLETIAGSSSLETSYRRVTAFRAGDILEGPPSKPTGVQVDKLKILLDGEEAYPCENILERTLAAARTFKRRVEAQVCGYGDVLSDFNFNTSRKRVLNQKYEPSFDDNVKQDKSIDVYGREDEEVAKQVADLENI